VSREGGKLREREAVDFFSTNDSRVSRAVKGAQVNWGKGYRGKVGKSSTGMVGKFVKARGAERKSTLSDIEGIQRGLRRGRKCFL